MKNLRDRFYEKRFGQAGRARDQTVTAGKQSDENLLDDIDLADHDLAEFADDPAAGGLQFLEDFSVVCHRTRKVSGPQ